MKTLLFILLTLSLYSNEKWIKIKPIHAKNSVTKEDINVSQRALVKKMLQDVTIVKQLIDTPTKAKKPIENHKDWFIIKAK